MIEVPNQKSQLSRGQGLCFFVADIRRQCPAGPSESSRLFMPAKKSSELDFDRDIPY